MNYIPNTQAEKFWSQQIYPVLTSVIEGKSRFPEINQMYRENTGLIIQNFGVQFGFTCHDKPSPDTIEGGCLPLGCRLDSGTPNVCVFVPTLQKISEQVRKSNPKGWRDEFELMLIVGFMHELDHCALKEVTEKINSFEEMIKSEIRVWARTCEQTLRPLIEIHNARISQSDLRYYKAWLRCGRMTDGSEWKEYIAKMYNKLKRNK